MTGGHHVQWELSDEPAGGWMGLVWCHCGFAVTLHCTTERTGQMQARDIADAHRQAASR